MTSKKASKPNHDGITLASPSVFDDALKAEGIDPETGRRGNASTFVRTVKKLADKLDNIGRTATPTRPFSRGLARHLSGRTRTDAPNVSNRPRSAKG